MPLTIRVGPDTHSYNPMPAFVAILLRESKFHDISSPDRHKEKQKMGKTLQPMAWGLFLCVSVVELRVRMKTFNRS
ncbi:hypothetical protein SBDP1_900009 [Syntrophobacter sp. SbD1]|nr:hypothetical protein SBDP1_900009 [Syntrophobacter sp. SbD1]